MTDDQVLFALWFGAILIILGIATLLEHFILWVLSKFRIERDGDPIEIHAEKPNPL